GTKQSSALYIRIASFLAMTSINLNCQVLKPDCFVPLSSIGFVIRSIGFATQSPGVSGFAIRKRSD
ncbi:MAG: hypothetical protein LBT42_02775, partial [Tannerella sp.]|nr:hypothetical protein [Tannerella sp.]